MIRRVLSCCLIPLLVLPALVCAAPDGLAAQQDELHKLRGYLAQVSEQVKRLQADLGEAERRNRLQSRLIDRLEATLKQRAACARQQRQVRQAFFQDLARRLPASPVYRVERDRVVVPADLVFIFSKARLGAEGEARLAGLARGLRAALEALPADLGWRLRIEGHTDPRPLKDTREFPTNWELSAARATEVLRYLRRHGLPGQRLEAVALADTVPRAPGSSRADYRRDRRIELHLEFPGD